MKQDTSKDATEVPEEDLTDVPSDQIREVDARFLEVIAQKMRQKSTNKEVLKMVHNLRGIAHRIRTGYPQPN